MEERASESARRGVERNSSVACEYPGIARREIGNSKRVI
jgi:hypothetical protein